MSGNLAELPDNLPRPLDDGGADHLWNAQMPEVVLKSTLDEAQDADSLTRGKKILFFYPMTGKPGVPLPEGWDEIPGARGCTPEALMFSKLQDEFLQLGYSIIGISVQDTEYQLEMAHRLGLVFPVLSDVQFKLAGALKLPTMEVAGVKLIKRLTLVVINGTIKKVFYPVFPPDKHPAEVLHWAKCTTTCGDDNRSN